MPAIFKVPLPQTNPIPPFRGLFDSFEFNSFFTYRTLATSFTLFNGFDSNHFGAIQAAYRKQAPKLEALQLNKPKQVQWFTDKLPLSKDSVVLDLNCGTGHVARAIGKQVKEVKGTDISRHLISFAKTKAPADNIEFHQCEASELPFEDNTFDVVFSRFSFNNFTHREQVIEELRRVCKPGGHIALMERVVPDGIDQEAAIKMEFIEGTRDPSHIAFMTPTEMNNLFKENGIEATTKETTICKQPLDEFLEQFEPNSVDHEAMSQFIYANMVAPDPSHHQETGFYPHIINDTVTLTHHLAMIGGKNPTEKPTPKPKAAQTLQQQRRQQRKE